MKCPDCKGNGELYLYDLEGEPYLCPTCRGEGVVFSVSDPQPWDIDHSRWGRFDSHETSKWKSRFVVSGCDCYGAVIKFLFEKYHIEYSGVHFYEEKVFPGENESYMYPCIYFFPTHERDPKADVTKAELTELYWY
jgi:hypothetical protein